MITISYRRALVSHVWTRRDCDVFIALTFQMSFSVMFILLTHACRLIVIYLPGYVIVNVYRIIEIYFCSKPLHLKLFHFKGKQTGGF